MRELTRVSSPMLSSILAGPTDSREKYCDEREELLCLLVKEGILYRSPAQPVLSRDGKSARWMLNSLAVTLTGRGSELAGRCILELLRRFDGHQIATYGLTGIPLIQSCIVQSGGRYRGLIVRKERKSHGSLKLIEGNIDPAEPVILVDDSISSGLSMSQAIEYLEQAGLRVEGAIFLVRFGWDGGYESLQERGYHVEALFDVWDDIMSRMENEQLPPRNPSRVFPEFEWSEHRAPNNLHPVHLARFTLMEYLETGRLPLPPESLDTTYDSLGGVWVSVRDRYNIYNRHARNGFWHFPGEQSWGPAEDVVRAALRTAYDLPSGDEGRRIIETSNIAVTFFSRLEESTVGQIDNDRHGIVVCSRERISVMGGALPRMPGIADEWQQFQHARIKNAQLLPHEPFALYRHEVVKAVEPGFEWQPTGVPIDSGAEWYREPAVCGPIARFARESVLACIFGSSTNVATRPTANIAANIAVALPPGTVDSLFVTVYVQGRLRGCMGGQVSELERDLAELAAAAVADSRFDHGPAPETPEDVAVTVSFLYGEIELGEFLPEEVELRLRRGQQALLVHQGDRRGLLLPFVAVTNNLDRAAYIAEVIDKAGITRPPYNWTRFECATWFAGSATVCPLVNGFPCPPREPESSRESLLARLTRLYTDYLLRNQRNDGRMVSWYEPFQNRLYREESPPRSAHVAWTLARARSYLKEEPLRATRDRAVDCQLAHIDTAEDGTWIGTADDGATVSEAAFTLLALCELPAGDPRVNHARALAETLWASIDIHGRISTHRSNGGVISAADLDAFQDYFPAQVLLALAKSAQAGFAEVQEDRLLRAFRYYRHRFRYKRSFGQVSWLMQAMTEWYFVSAEAEYADLTFEICDWVLQYQQEKTGGFINDHQPDSPGFTTALYLEGLAAAARLARSLADTQRYERYLDSFTRGIRFIERITIQERDAPVLPNARYALGGLRQSIYMSQVRTDFVQHGLSAILGFDQIRYGER